MIRVVNLKNYVPVVGEVLVKIDRTSILGNPYYLKNTNSISERELVCDMYEYDHFNKILGTSTSLGKVDIDEKAFRDELNRIYLLAKNGNVAIGCWCHPKRCHGDTIKKAIEKFL